ncbi:hypothetical protein HF289_05460 [Acidithiobacillus ferrooxidans]|uniref:hypothetical protein n=1 Tax=Acidithiobacillus ferrooxidans TaxID=920 RepID=UPI0013D73619|nr:hypothetical protein [Acidithiobacillus ferrooxidans]MBU2856338.1 hypothetical protein [Acidithiobacillus ferrooxidans]MBU2859504.1 hypothetical protein [Acidithiobacillus ferrooxidans]MCR2831190.1 hypothetical protein [Acidithiobacillus ferrooxidans]
MAIQLPEPDFYTLAEVTERWRVSEDVLFRLGAERKLILAWPIATGLSLYHDSGARIKSPWEETEGFEILERLHIWKRGGTGDDKNDIMPHGLALLDNRSIGQHAAISDGMILHPCFDRIDMTLNHIEENSRIGEAANNSPLPGYSYRLRAVTPYHFRATVPIYISELVIPTSEIHRIERQHEAAQKAAKEDILGTKEKEKYQAMIAAMA